MLNFSDVEVQKTVEYWTPERKQNAVPLTPPKYKFNEIDDKSVRNYLDEAAQIIIPSNTSNANPTTIIYGTPFKADVTQFPYHVGGKFFLTKVKTDGTTEDRVGSAQFVGHCSILLTAAHCVRDSVTGNYYTNLLFSRGYNDGNNDDFPISRVSTLDKYVGSTESARRSYDYAFAFTNRPFNDWIGLQVGNPHNAFRAIGYPSNYEKGEKMYAVDGTKGTVQDNVVEMIGNPFAPGASGGAWIAKFSTERDGLMNLAVGLNGGYALDGSEKWYSPLFLNRETIDLFYQVMNRERC
ncbi:hypothetical protein [Paenibacillus sp. FSL E2-0178]|uniref:trypsin-like serine peptidase n=1 Tax=Paenibacillus sp. FSL E2-0178 TaxID=2921361 RepID=UPI0031581FD2